MFILAALSPQAASPGGRARSSGGLMAGIGIFLFVFILRQKTAPAGAAGTVIQQKIELSGDVRMESLACARCTWHVSPRSTSPSRPAPRSSSARSAAAITNWRRSPNGDPHARRRPPAPDSRRGRRARQDYRFEVPEFICNVSVEKDRSLVIYYKITFRCAPGAHPIDIVDIGFPSKDYQLDSVRAQIGGVALSGIKPSSYISNGVEIPLGDKAIGPGQTGTLRPGGTNLYMVFQDSDVPADGSMEFSPTWFDGNLLEGTTAFTLQVQFPEAPSRTRCATTSGRSPNRSSPTPAGSFTSGRNSGGWTASTRWVFRSRAPWWKAPLTPPEAPVAAWRSSSGDDFFDSGCFCVPGFLIPILPAVISIVRGFYRRRKYLPPKIGVEGVGIKRGLTAPMAALLNEEKLDRVTVLILYGLLREGRREAQSRSGGQTLSSRRPRLIRASCGNTRTPSSIRSKRTDRSARRS